MNSKTTPLMLAALAALFVATTVTRAATINFSSLETVLANPDDKMSKMSAAWTPWPVQQREYNMPYIELTNTTDFAIDRFTMTIGDTRYRFSNEFYGKENTNSHPFPANGDYALTGFSTPNVNLNPRVANFGNSLILDFGLFGLRPGQTAIFQVDIDRDLFQTSLPMFADYTSVFFNNGEGDDTSGNSQITIDYLGTDLFSEITLPNFELDGSVAQFLQAPRPYNVMQTVPLFPNTTLDVIPEPTSGLLAVVAGLGLVARRRR